jgi:hypothetical protein
VIQNVLSIHKALGFISSIPTHRKEGKEEEREEGRK